MTYVFALVGIADRAAGRARGFSIV